MENNLKHYIMQIEGSNRQYEQNMMTYLDGLTKPVGALGKLETMVSRLAGIQETLVPRIGPQTTIIMCADNGVCDEGVSSCPQEVTATVTVNFTRGITAMNQLSKAVGATLYVVDIGVKATIEEDGVHNRKIRYGTNNMCIMPAMTRDETLRAIGVGIEAVEACIEKGVEIFGTGEMGIGNTTTSAAVTACLLGLDVERVTGKGAGADQVVYHNKVNAIKKAIAQHAPNPQDPIDVLAKVGGLDLCGLVGVYIACARHKKPVVIDGLISSAAALVAARLVPVATDYMFASHLSEECGMQAILEALGLEAHLHLGMRLGEGSGCPLLFQLMNVACQTLLGMGTFEDAGVDRSRYENIWK